VLDVCDADVKSHCLTEKGLSSYRVGEIRKCLIGFLPVQSPGDSSKVDPPPSTLPPSSSFSQDLQALPCVVP